MHKYAVNIPHNSAAGAPWQCMTWLAEQGWHCHRMSHIHGIRGCKFLDWDLVPPHIKHHETYEFSDARKAMMFKLAFSGT